MEYHDEEKNGFKILFLNGRLDSATAPSFEHNLIGYVEAGHKNLILDFADLDYISSAGLRVILAAAKKVKAHQGKFGLSGLNANVMEVFEISGFDTILSIKKTVDDAIAANS